MLHRAAVVHGAANRQATRLAAVGRGRTNRPVENRSRHEGLGRRASVETTSRIRGDAGVSDALIAHVVLFKPRPDVTDAERQALVAAFEYAVRAIPDVRGVRVGRRVTHGAGYEQTAPDLANVLIVLDFDDLAGLQAYLRHPAHEELGARFSQMFSSGVVYDFEVGELRTVFSF